MNLNTINEVRRPSSASEVTHWRDGYAWLAGGTWLFSEPQLATEVLIDLESLHWPALTASDEGLEIAATCRIVDLDRFEAPAAWRAAPLLRDCCLSFLASFKVWNAATVGGNICMSLPAGPMTSLMVALEARYTLWPRDRPARVVPAADFITGDHRNVLGPGELLRSIHVPAEALRKQYAFRRLSLTKHGRSAVLLVGTRGPATGAVLVTVTAATVRPIQVRFATAPSPAELRLALEAAIPDALYLDDVHGSPAYRRRLTYYFAEQIRAELCT